MTFRLGWAPAIVAALAMVFGWAGACRAEDLQEAWAIALRVNQGLQAQQATSFSDGFSLAAARAARLPTLRLYDATTFLSQSPTLRVSGNNLGGGGVTPSPLGILATPGTVSGTGAAGIPQPLLGPNQTTVPFVFSYLQQPIYTGGRIKNNIASAGHQLNAQKTEEARSVLDLKLTVAEAFVGVLRARQSLEVASSNVKSLASFTVDVKNRKKEKLATRNEELAAEVSLANARLSEITAAKNLKTAESTYNRYVCREPTAPTNLTELAAPPSGEGLEELASALIRSPNAAGIELNESEVFDLVLIAFRARPELAGLAERAMAANAQARANQANIRPQISVSASYVYPGNNNIVNPNIFAGTVLVNWILFDGGQTRKKTRALQQQERALLKQKADLAADIALQVRTRWLDLNEARQRTTIASGAVLASEENLKVVRDRYNNALSIYTEVLDAETRRIQSINNYYNSSYDQSLALFRLRRAVGDL